MFSNTKLISTQTRASPQEDNPDWLRLAVEADRPINDKIIEEFYTDEAKLF